MLNNVNLTEDQMEKMLSFMGYDILDNSQVVDSTKVFDLAADLGWGVKIDPSNQMWTFSRDYVVGSVERIACLLIDFLHSSYALGNGGSSFAIWCDENLDDKNQESLMQKVDPIICQLVGVFEDWEEPLDVVTKED